MSTIAEYISDICAQKAVYWSNPQSNGFGRMTYDDPEEIDCFWIDEQETKTDDSGKEWVTNAKVYVLVDLDEQGVLWLGTLTSLSTAQKNDPLANLQKAREIKRFVKTPSLYDESTYVRKAVLDRV
jgi:hypothetical protein